MKRPKAGEKKLPKKGGFPQGKVMKLNGFGTIREILKVSSFHNWSLHSGFGSAPAQVALEQLPAQTHGICPSEVQETEGGTWKGVSKECISVSQPIIQCLVSCLQDFGTQVHFWRQYRDTCDSKGVEYGKYVTAALGEHMSGLLLSISVGTSTALQTDLSCPRHTTSVDRPDPGSCHQSSFSNPAMDEVDPGHFADHCFAHPSSLVVNCLVEKLDVLAGQEIQGGISFYGSPRIGVRIGSVWYPA